MGWEGAEPEEGGPGAGRVEGVLDLEVQEAVPRPGFIGCLCL